MASYHSHFFAMWYKLCVSLLNAYTVFFALLGCFMFSVLFMSINIRIVFGLQILYLCIHFSFACFNQCNNFDSATYVATANQLSGIDTCYQHVQQL